MSFQSPSHANANALQRNILIDILGVESCKIKGVEAPKIDSRAKAELIRTWIELEHLKRELRGIARLKPCDITDLVNRAKKAVAHQEPIELAPAGEAAEA